MKVLFMEKGEGAQIKKRYNIRNETKSCDKMKWLTLAVKNKSAVYLVGKKFSR